MVRSQGHPSCSHRDALLIYKLVTNSHSTLPQFPLDKLSPHPPKVRGQPAIRAAARVPGSAPPLAGLPVMEIEFIQVGANFILSRQGWGGGGRGGEAIKGRKTPCCQPGTLMNPLLPKAIIGQNNSSPEINWTNYVGSQNPPNHYFLSGRAGVGGDCVVTEQPSERNPGFEGWAGCAYKCHGDQVWALIWLRGHPCSTWESFNSGKHDPFSRPASNIYAYRFSSPAPHPRSAGSSKHPTSSRKSSWI